MVDPVTAALLLAVATGASESVGGKVWDGLSSLIHRWFKRDEADDGEVIDDLEQLRQGNGAAARLAKALTDRAETDVAFGAEMAAWQVTAARQVYVQSNVITGGRHDTVVMAGRVDNLTIQAPGQAVLGAQADLRPTPGQVGLALAGDDTAPISAGVLIQIREAGIQLPPLPYRSLAGLPMRRPGFTARRADLKALLGSLAPDDGVPVTVVVGPPGVGKTALAIEVGHEARAAGWFPCPRVPAYEPGRRASRGTPAAG